MCVSIPGRVVALHDNLADLDVLGAQRTASTMLMPEVKLGDYVLTNAGMIVSILDEEDAMASIALFEELMALDLDDEGAPA